ncbi:KIN1, partial [Enterospora canceri]
MDVSSEANGIGDISAEENIEVEGDFFLKKSVDYVEDQWIGKYRMEKTLGKGSSAKVVEAVDKETGETVAIKIIDRKAKNISDKRVFREVLICSLVSHPHVARLLDFFFTGKYFFLVFEHVSGEQLYNTVLQNGPIGEERVRRYFRQILSAVDYLHKNAVVHRDLKIENIMIDKDDNVKLIDFGLSNFYEKEDQLSTFCGSLYFAAPELLQGNRYVGPEVDVWSLGVVLYVMLCGRVPFDDESIHKLQGKIKECKFTFH